MQIVVSPWKRRLTNLTSGYSPVTYLVVANLGLTGLLVSWIMKFADSIMKVSAMSSFNDVPSFVMAALYKLQHD